MTNVDTQQPAGAALIWTGMIAKTHVMALSRARDLVRLETIVSRRAERAKYRARASSKAAARFITSGKLGNLGLVEIAVPLWRGQDYYDELGRGTYERDGGGVLLTQAIHSIDLALNLTGPVSTIRAATTTTPLHPMAPGDFVVAGLRFASGAVGSLVASTAPVVNRRDGIQQIVPPDPQGSVEAHLAGAT
jgi:hypothetical protein